MDLEDTERREVEAAPRYWRGLGEQTPISGVIEPGLGRPTDFDIFEIWSWPRVSTHTDIHTSVPAWTGQSVLA